MRRSAIKTAIATRLEGMNVHADHERAGPAAITAFQRAPRGELLAAGQAPQHLLFVVEAGRSVCDSRPVSSCTTLTTFVVMFTYALRAQVAGEGNDIDLADDLVEDVVDYLMQSAMDATIPVSLSWVDSELRGPDAGAVLAVITFQAVHQHGEE